MRTNCLNLSKCIEYQRSLNMYRVLGVDDLPTQVCFYDNAVDIASVENKTGEITLNVYLFSMTDIMSTC